MDYNLKQIKNILFDLGGVIVDLNEAETKSQFAEFRESDLDESALEVLFYQKLIKFETGQLSTELFINFLIKHSNVKTQALDIITAWNSMCLGVSQDKMDSLRLLSKKFNLHLLSNNNPLHLEWLLDYLDSNLHTLGFLELFEKLYFSHLIEMRKPDSSCFEFVLSDANINAEETLFVDDSLENIKAAQNMGYLVYHIHASNDLIKLQQVLLGDH